MNNDRQSYFSAQDGLVNQPTTAKRFKVVSVQTNYLTCNPMGADGKADTTRTAYVISQISRNVGDVFYAIKTGEDKVVATGKHAFHFDLGPSVGLFFVTVTKNSGSAGGPNTPSSWTYDVKDITGSNAIASNVPVTKPRQNGNLAFATAGSIALGGYNGSTFILWEVGELPGTVECNLP